MHFVKIGKMKNKDVKVDLTKFTREREFELGTRYINWNGKPYTYVKKDAGRVGKIKGKVYRDIEYFWFPEWFPLNG